MCTCFQGLTMCDPKRSPPWRIFIRHIGQYGEADIAHWDCSGGGAACVSFYLSTSKRPREKARYCAAQGTCPTYGNRPCIRTARELQIALGCHETLIHKPLLDDRIHLVRFLREGPMSCRHLSSCQLRQQRLHIP